VSEPAPSPWKASILSLFPDMFPGPLGGSLAGRALTSGLWNLDVRDIRSYTTDRHRTVDDKPAGGGAGMVLRPDIVAVAIDAARLDNPAAEAIYLSPRGEPLTQSTVRSLAAAPGIIALCGRFEGVDERVIDGRGLREISIGDYVLSGGELAAMVLVDAVVRLLPGVMGKEASGEHESFEDGLLEYPHYTKPRVWEDRPIPDILLSGDHQRVEAWRQEQSEQLTRQRRPDLWERRCRSKKECE
jgi:tRNA (guanine37-N1)-methyltransferase